MASVLDIGHYGDDGSGPDEVTDIRRTDSEELQSALQLEINDADFSKLEKQARELADEISEGLLYHLKDNLSSWLADHVASSAASVIEAILKGNENEARRYLGLKPSAYYDGREEGARPWFKSNSELHEFGPIELRHKIVDAHRDLITDARIGDLEAQLKGLVEKYYRMERTEVPGLRHRLAEAADALRAAERFMGGFEGDELQDGIDERLFGIRAAIAKAEGS